MDLLIMVFVGLIVAPIAGLIYSIISGIWITKRDEMERRYAARNKLS